MSARRKSNLFDSDNNEAHQLPNVDSQLKIDHTKSRKPLPNRRSERTRTEIAKYLHPCYEPDDAPHKSKGNISNSLTDYEAPASEARWHLRDYMHHNGVHYQLGDIVAVTDKFNRGIFYAQITGFWIDQYCFKCATIQWLLPTKQSPPPRNGFDPVTYVLGFLDETPRPLESLMPVMKCPSDYFRVNPQPFPPCNKDEPSFVLKHKERVSLNPFEDAI